ncbi:hypothetical protein A9Z40_03255 [Microbacterium arborescens]|uniref:Uncharacterized protein n=1 Tax=Microbacterium arborescens TaxID=33883 RepID=A0ABX2WIU2_9MICO|nr:hypothetical protein A9Z40_03255 [Microbacterium arborescens]
MTDQYVDPRAGAITWDEWTRTCAERQSWTQGTRDASQTAVQSVPWRTQSIVKVKVSHVQAWVTGEIRRGCAP